MELLKENAAEFLHHERGADFLADVDMKQAFWDCFPNSMHDWLNNEQDVDPFDANNPLDIVEIADQFQRYWNIHFKNERKNNGENNSGGKRKDSDSDDQDGGNKRHKGGRGN